MPGIRNKQILWDSPVDFDGQELENLGAPQFPSSAARLADVLDRATVGSGGKYASVEDAFTAEDYKVEVISNVVETGDLVIPENVEADIKIDNGVTLDLQSNNIVYGALTTGVPGVLSFRGPPDNRGSRCTIFSRTRRGNAYGYSASTVVDFLSSR